MDINEIFESIKRNKRAIIDLRGADFGRFVFIGAIQGKETTFENNVGYLVQIREKRGDFGTDQVLVRHPNGNITSHENQFFFSIDHQDAMLMLPYFNTIPGHELIENNFKLTFSVNGVKENGFYIEAKK